MDDTSPSMAPDDVRPDDLMALLEALEQSMPDVSAALLEREVSDLLGREPAAAEHRPTPRGALPTVKRRRNGDRASAFEWFGQLVARWPIMDRADTIRAAIEVEVGVLAEEHLAIPRSARLDRDELADLHLLADIGRRSYARLVLSNLRLVFHWSKGVARSIDSDWAQDAFQVGCMGLMRGIQGWDYRMGFTLSTFVSWHVRQSIQRWRANDILLIRIPVHVWEGLESEDKPLAPALRIAAERAQNIYSLDEMTGEEPWFEGDGGLTDSIDALERVRTVGRALDALDEREGRILRMRFGIGEDALEPMTLEEVGAAFGFTRERARQIEGKAKAKLQGLSELRDLID